MKGLFSESPDNLEERVDSLQTALVNLINNSLETKSIIDNLSERINKLQISQKQTDERLNAMILMIEKFLNNKNGNL